MTGSRARRRGLASLLVAAVLGAATTAEAQITALPPAVAAAVRTVGPTVDGPGMAALFAPFQAAEPYVGVTVLRDQAYGPDPRHLANLFRPDVAKGALPLLIFVHGGGFTAGERRMGPTSPFYDNVGVWAARHAFVGITMTYRLAPGAKWPAGPQDIDRALAWARANARSWGADPRQVFLMGHSAGATHVADYISHPALQHGPPVQGAIIVSGSFTVTPAVQAPADEASFSTREKAYFGDDPALYAEEDAIPGLVASKAPLLLVGAELDPPFFRRQAQALDAALTKAGRPKAELVLAGHGHMSEIMAVGSADHGLTDAILAFVTQGARSRAAP